MSVGLATLATVGLIAVVLNNRSSDVLDERRDKVKAVEGLAKVTNVPQAAKSAANGAGVGTPFSNDVTDNPSPTIQSSQDEPPEPLRDPLEEVDVDDLANKDLDAAPDVKEKPSNIPEWAKTSGSMSVWTEPRDPVPRKPYDIIIDIDISKLGKEGLKSYPRGDLSGSVVGSDKYKQDFGGRKERGSLPIIDEHVRLKVRVPAALKLVRDTIRVRSELLNEDQEIKIAY